MREAERKQRTNTSPREAQWPCANTFMSDILNKTIVLVLNRNWQAINIRTPQEAFCMMATNVATALEIQMEDSEASECLSLDTRHPTLVTPQIRPITWDEWITLPIRDGDHAVQTV